MSILCFMAWFFKSNYYKIAHNIVNSSTNIFQYFPCQFYGVVFLDRTNARSRDLLMKKKRGDGEICYKRRCVKSPSCARNNNFTTLASLFFLSERAAAKRKKYGVKNFFNQSPSTASRKTRSNRDKTQRMTCSPRKNSRHHPKVNKPSHVAISL